MIHAPATAGGMSVQAGSETSASGLAPPPPLDSDCGPGVSLGTSAGMPVVTLAGLVDRELTGRAASLLQLATFEQVGPIAIDVSAVDAVNGALLGLLLRTSRRLAWRNRQLIIVCRAPETIRRLRIAGLDELATLVESA